MSVMYLPPSREFFAPRAGQQQPLVLLHEPIITNISK